MARKIIDCREFPESKCSVALSADSEQELVDAAILHAVQVHGHEDTPEFREELRKIAKDERPSA